MSFWMKLGSSTGYILGVPTTTNPRMQLYYTASNGVIEWYQSDSGGTTVYYLVPTQVFRDPSAWYHMVIVADTTQVTSSNRLKWYVNGQQINSFSTATYPAQNTLTEWNAAAVHNIGRTPSGGGANYWDGYLAEVNFIDGQALTPSSFGETSSTTGVWIPKKYTGTYGTNGFYLPFTDNSALTTSSNAGLGKDFSGNANYWTTNNISITSGSTYDSMTDVPTLTSATAANFATLNPVAAGDYFASGQTSLTLSNANLNYGTGGRNAFGTIAVSSGKYYWEMSNTSNAASAVPLFGLVTVAARASVYGVYYQPNGNKGLGTLNSGATETSYGATWTDNDIIGVALDMDAATPTVTFYKNNTSQGAISVSSFVGQSVMVWIQNGANSGNMSGWINHGQRPFTYTPPTGFVALNTFNLPTPTIGATASTTANKYFDINLWTGNNANPRTLTGLSFQPDWVWLKDRSQATNHRLVDAVRGASKTLKSNTTDAETSSEVSGTITAFTSNGFTVEGTSNVDGVNLSGDAYVGWNWKANGSGSTNTAGSITSTVSANTTAGFSIVTYTGTGSNATVGHGLGVAPSMVIVKRRPTAGSNWPVWHIGIANTEYLMLNSTNAKTTGLAWWNSTSPTSTVFSVGSDPDTNGTVAIVAYCFAPIAGYSAFGSYTGNGSTDGPFIFIGFRPRWLMIKRTDATQNWAIVDTSRDTFNVSNKRLFANLSDAEDTGIPNFVDLLSNGFKFRDSNVSCNASGGTYIYMAFAETPLKFSNAR
jgi:hypothetical protein